MQTIGAFFRLIRWPNLVFIALTQILFYTCIYIPLFPAQPVIQKLFILLAIASIFIAASGYIINDYFDLHIDAINKPSKVVVDKYIKRRWAIIWHMLLSSAGLLLSLYVSYRLRQPAIAIGNFLCIILLWFYSTTFKRKLLSGNIIISALTAWVIVIIYFFAASATQGHATGTGLFFPADAKRFYWLTLAYASFAFIVSLIREVIKDMEDLEGDVRYKCNTMPVAWGIPASKVFVAVWLVVSAAALAALVIYSIQSGWWLVVIYIVLFILSPMGYVLKKLRSAAKSPDYHHLSNLMKLIMLAGIVTMIFFLF